MPSTTTLMILRGQRKIQDFIDCSINNPNDDTNEKRKWKLTNKSAQKATPAYLHKFHVISQYLEIYGGRVYISIISIEVFRKVKKVEEKEKLKKE